MKKLLIIPVLLALAVLIIHAGQYRMATILDGTDALVYTTNTLGVVTNTTGTNNVILANTNATARAGTSNRIQRATLINGCCVGFFTSYKLVGAGTAGPTFTIQKSYDGTNWESALTFSNAANGTTLVSYWTNLALYQFGYVRLSEVTNNAASAITNLCIRWYNKENE